MNKLSVSIAVIWLACSVAACSSEPSSTSSDGGSGASGTGAGGSMTGGTPGGDTGGSPVGGGGSGGSLVGGSGGGPTGGGGSLVGGSGGGPTGGGGSLVGGSGGNLAGGSGGSPTGGGGGSPTGGVATGGGGGDETGGVPTGGGGGDETGGVGTGGGSTEPELVTSAENDYWNTEGQLTELASGSADLTIDENTTYQLWDGFGGTFNEMGWDALQALSQEDRDLAIRLLFDPQDGARFVYGRIPIGASDYSMSYYTLDDLTSGTTDYDMEQFSLARDKEMLIPYIKAALEVRPDLHLWGSPWIVPDWMLDGRNMRSDAQTLRAHALYFARFVEDYGKEGMTIEAVHLQNEPGYARLTWNDTVFINFFKTYMGPVFEERGVTAEIWDGTISNPDKANLVTSVANDPASMEYVTGFGLQWNHEDTVALVAPFGRVMQTEHRCGNYNFSAKYWDQSRYSSTTPQNDHLYGEESWQLIRDWIVGGVNSYCAWNMVLDTQGRSLDGWPQNALLVVNRSAQSLIPTAAYYVFRHFSYYIVPGATRIGISGSNDALAFKNPDGSIVAEIYNSGGSSSSTTVGVGASSYQFDVPAHGWATLRVVP